MSKANRYQTRPQPVVVPTTPAPQPAMVDRGRVVAAVAVERPNRYVALTGLRYTNRMGDLRDVRTSAIVDDLSDEDRDGYLKLGAIEPEPNVLIDDNEEG